MEFRLRIAKFKDNLPSWKIRFVCYLLLCFQTISVFADQPRQVKIPIADIIEHGIFEAGTSFLFGRDNDFSHQETILDFDFGLFNWIEIGINHQKTLRIGDESALLGHLKLQLLKEQDLSPHLSIGVKDLNNIKKHRSMFLSFSKKLNLPKMHIVGVHFGIGNDHYGMESSTGLFGGFEKEFSSKIAPGDFSLVLQFDRRGVSGSLLHTADTGLQTMVGSELLNNGGQVRFLAKIAFTNKSLVKRIEETQRLAKQAARLVGQGKSGKN